MLSIAPRLDRSLPYVSVPAANCSDQYRNAVHLLLLNYHGGNGCLLRPVHHSSWVSGLKCCAVEVPLAEQLCCQTALLVSVKSLIKHIVYKRLSGRLQPEAATTVCSASSPAAVGSSCCMIYSNNSFSTARIHQHQRAWLFLSMQASNRILVVSSLLCSGVEHISKAAGQVLLSSSSSSS